ncbi:hypothetical protein [Brevundimonas diminuta]|uniref:hypothetical protein n=1 Tax=Brevundimonas diminuta TaxID=293 RepID=UPI003F7EDE99
MADRDQQVSREDDIRRAVFDRVDLQTAELEIVGSIYDGFAAAIVVTGQPRTVAVTREYGDAVQLMALIERGRAPLLAIDLAEGAMPSKTFVKPASVGRSDGPIFAGFVDAADAPAAPQEARPQAREEAQSVSLPTDEGGCVTKRFVIFTTPGWAPEKKGGWLKDEHLIDFLRSVMLHDDWKPGFRATVLELTWDNDLWASSATEYLSMHDEAIGPRRARKAWQEARTKHERIYKAAPKMRLGDEIDSYRKATAITHPAPDALQRAVEAIRAQINAPLTGPTHGAWDRGRIAGLKEALAALQAEHKGGA